MSLGGGEGGGGGGEESVGGWRRGSRLYLLPLLSK